MPSPSALNGVTKPSTLTLLEIIPHLPRLPRRDLLLIRATVDHLLGGERDSASPLSVSPLFEALIKVAGVRLPFAEFQQTTCYKQWLVNEKLVLGFVSDAWGELDKVTSQSLLVYLLEMLATDLRTRAIPVSVGSLVLNLGSVPQAFDQNFPDYLRNGMADLVLRAMGHK